MLLRTGAGDSSRRGRAAAETGPGDPAGSFPTEAEEDPRLPSGLPDRPILFFGGKGGVGKTTLASMAALESADGGRRTLLVSTDPAHSTSDILQAELGPAPRPVVADLWAMEIDPEREADEYVARVRERVAAAAPPRIVAEVERQIDIARVSPGAAEAALFDRFARILDGEAGEYGRIIFDTAPTGQTLRLLSLPELMTAWMNGLIRRREKVGALARMWRNVAGSEKSDRERADPLLEALEERRARFHRARALLTAEERTAFVFVLVPERLPIWETEKAVAALARHGIPVGAIVVNQVLPEPGESESVDGFLRARRERQRGYLASISESLGDWPLLRLRLQDSDPVGVDALRRLRLERMTRERKASP